MRLTSRLMILCAAVMVGGCTDPVVSPEAANTGRLELNIATSGDDPDTDGYSVFVSGETSSLSATISVPANGSATINDLAPGRYDAALSGLAGNCVATSTGNRSIVITGLQVTRLSMSLLCTEALQLTYETGGGWDDDSPPREFATIGVNGKNAAPLTSDRAWHESPAWSPDGNRLAFGTDRGNRFGIWIMDAAGDATPLNTGVRETFGPRWSSDGKRLVFYGRAERALQLYISDADGTNLTRITSDTAGDFHPDLSPDGATIVFSSMRGGTREIWLVGIDGSGSTRLTSNKGVGDFKPVWSPDGTSIAFQRITSSADAGIYIMKRDGTDLRRFAQETAYGGPAWSPDGKNLAFTGKACDKGDCSNAIMIYGIDGTRHSPIFIKDVVGDVAWRPRR